MVGRSLPMTLLSVWEKYRLQWGGDDGREGFRVPTALRSRIELRQRLRAAIAPRP
jgi:hypothetical protein